MRTRPSAPARLEASATSRASGSSRWAPLRSYGVTAIAFESGHALRLQVVRTSPSDVLRRLWHRAPGGSWVAYTDRSVDAAWDSPPSEPLPGRGEAAPISLSWPGSRSLTVEIDAPRLRWALSLGGSPLTRLVNRLLPRLPVESYRRHPAFALVRSVSEEALGPGPGELVNPGAGTVRVSGHPRRIFLVDATRAELDGVDLGRPLGFDSGTGLGPPRWPALGALVEA
jgi:hypothetical protein